MVKQLKTLNVAQGGYESPRCKIYSFTVEGVIAAQTNRGGGGSYDDDEINNNDDY
jgi:hypothetical protein